MTRSFLVGGALLPLLALSACDPFSNMPDQDSTWLDGALWDTEVTAAIDGVYIRLPQAGKLVRVKNGGTYDVVDLRGASPTKLIATPDGEQVLVFARWQVCADPEVKTPDDCDDDDLSYKSELVVIDDAQRVAVTTVPTHLNQLAFSDDNSVAVAYLDFEAGDDIDIDNGIIDLTEVVFIDLASGETTSVSIGFSPSNVLFSADGSIAVVMSRSKVVAVDLATFEKVVEYPLTLDADDEIDPSDAVLTPDGTEVLVAIEGTSELYKLDLVNYSIDIITLDDVPTDLAVSNEADRTVVTYRSSATVDVLEHEYYSSETVQLDEPMNSILMDAGQAVLYNTNSNDYHDVYRLDLTTSALVEYRVDNPIEEMQLTDSGLYAVALLRPEGGFSDDLEGYQDARYGLGVIDLSSDDAVSLVLDRTPLGLALVEPDEGGTYALVLTQGSDTLLQVDLTKPSVPIQIPLSSPAVGIGTLPAGGFYITHESALGELSFLDPTTGNTTTVSGFAALGLFADDELPRQGGE